MTTTRGLLRLTRASIALSPIADGIAGQALARARGFDATWIESGCGLLAALFLFLFGMAQNDLADRVADAGRASRPIPAGEVSVRAARIVVLACGVLALGCAALASFAALAVALVMVALISLYNLAPRHLGLAGPAVLGSIRGADLCLGAATLGSPWAALAVAVPYAGYVGALSVVARMEDGALAVSRRRIAEMAVVAGACPLLALGAASPASVPLGLGAAVVCALLVLWLRRAFRALPPSDAPPPGAIARFVGAALSGIFLFDAAVATAAGAPVAAAAVLLMFGASRALVRRFPPS